LACAFAGEAQAALIQEGFYNLHNHPVTAEGPPDYGLRLDELFDATPNHDIFTFDFDHPDSNMQMEISLAGPPVLRGQLPSGIFIHIFGQAQGGRDIGTVHAPDQFLGLYNIDFTYFIGVEQKSNDDDLWVVAPTASNFGTITPPASAGGQTIPLWDKSDGTNTFRLGDEDSDQGHRGFQGISGWGWLNHGSVDVHVPSSDWLFTAAPVPTPGTMALLGLGAVVFWTRRR